MHSPPRGTFSHGSTRHQSRIRVLASPTFHWIQLTCRTDAVSYGRGPSVDKALPTRANSRAGACVSVATGASQSSAALKASGTNRGARIHCATPCVTPACHSCVARPAGPHRFLVRWPAMADVGSGRPRASQHPPSCRPAARSHLSSSGGACGPTSRSCERCIGVAQRVC